MSFRQTFIFFLWRRDGTTPGEFSDYYNEHHLKYVSSVVPMPSIHERSFPLDTKAIYPANTVRQGIFSFDSFTVATFDSEEGYNKRAKILSDSSIRKSLAEDEQKFTAPARRVNFAVEVEGSEATAGLEFGPPATSVVVISRRRPGTDGATLKAQYEAEISRLGTLDKELRHLRYYIQREHPFSTKGGVWGEEVENAIDVVQDIIFESREAAERGIERLWSAMVASIVIDGSQALILGTWRQSGIPGAN